MRSEQLIRFPGADEAPRTYCESKLREQQEITNQVAEFLARGGRIERLSHAAGVQPTFAFNIGSGAGAVIDRRPHHFPEREEVDGVTLIRRRVVARKAGYAPETLTKWIAVGKFPAPVRFDGRVPRWSEVAVDEWVVAHRAEGQRKTRGDARDR